MNPILIICPNDQEFFHQTLIPGIKNHFPKIQILVSKDFSSAQQELSHKHFATVMIQKMSPKGNNLLDFLVYLKKAYPDTSRILFAEVLTSSEIMDYVNQASIMGVFDSTWPIEKIFEMIQKSIDQYLIKSRRIQLVEDIAQLNRTLERTTQRLEKEDEDRRQHIRSAQLDAQKKRHEAEKLVHLVQKLGTITNFEDYLLTLKAEYKKWHRVMDSFLLVRPFTYEATLYFLQGRAMKKLKSLPPIQTQTEDINLRKILADLFSRPLGQILKISFGDNGWLLFEHILQEKELKDFRASLYLNKQGLEIAFQRILQDREQMKVAKIWQKTFDVISDPIVILDSTGRILRQNKRFALIHIQDSFVLQKLKKAERNEDTPYQIPIQNQLFEVNCFYINLHSSLTSAHQHKVYFLRDVTVSKALYSQIVQQEKMVALGHLAGNITHELNNPLTGLRALAQIIMTELDPSSHLYNDLMEIENALKRSQKVIENLLEFTSLETDLSIQYVELDDLVKKTMPFLKTATKFHKLSLHLNSKGFCIKGSPQLIQQVIFNLINNACQAVPADGNITIATDFNEEKNLRGT